MRLKLLAYLLRNQMVFCFVCGDIQCALSIEECQVFVQILLALCAAQVVSQEANLCLSPTAAASTSAIAFVQAPQGFFSLQPNFTINASGLSNITALLCDGDRRNARSNLERKLGLLLGLEPNFGPRLSDAAKR